MKRTAEGVIVTEKEVAHMEEQVSILENCFEELQRRLEATERNRQAWVVFATKLAQNASKSSLEGMPEKHMPWDDENA